MKTDGYCSRLLRMGWIGLILIGLAACGGGGDGDENGPIGMAPPSTPVPAPNPTPDPPPDPDPDPAPEPRPTANMLGLEKISDAAWDETAVRQVLDVFAYGGHARDAQITVWANMPPDEAILEILSFDEHNLKLSATASSDSDDLHLRPGTLQALATFWASDDPANPMPALLRDEFDVSNFTGWNEAVWTTAATSRGLNPFRQKIGLWETNYHMATSTSKARNPQVLGYYDEIMNSLANDSPYQDVVSTGALSAAVAMQYGHRDNLFRNNFCYCNEDFAREYYQLYFGIQGEDDSNYHEMTTIKNTAKALTDMRVFLDPTAGYDAAVTFGTNDHFPFTLELLHAPNAGATADSRIDQLSQIAIEHPESLRRLPIMIVAGLADDNLSENTKALLRSAWASMPSKNLLTYLRAYSISTLFHSPARIKYWTSIDRHIMFANKASIDNRDTALRVYGQMQYQDEFVSVFQPSHGVFGSQSGKEAAASSDIFLNNFNRATERGWLHRRTTGEFHGETWSKDFRDFVPRNSDGEWVTENVAEWLWQRYVADGLRNFGPLERAHVYALLGSDYDLAFLLSPADEDRVITSADLTADAALQMLIQDLATMPIALDSADPSTRIEAGRRVGQAINFIAGTPFVLAQEGR